VCWLAAGRSGPQISVDAHTDDVNVISWNRQVSYLLASGCDDGSFKVSVSVALLLSGGDGCGDGDGELGVGSAHYSRGAAAGPLPLP
jgi:ribosome assembly protein RRB1